MPVNGASAGRLDVEADLRSALHPADLSFRDLGKESHAPQVADREEDRRLHRGGNGLAHVHVTADDDAVDGRSNDGAIQAHARLGDHGSRGGDAGLGAFHVGRSLQHGGTREIELGPRQLLVAGQRLRVLQLHAGVVQGRQTTGMLGLRSSEPGFGFGKTRLEQGRDRAARSPGPP